MTARTANFAHQRKLFDPRRAKRIVGFGAGAVGSWTALFLAKEGVVDQTWWDPDTIESHNVPMSLYGPDDVGHLKVDRLREHVERLTGVTIKTVDKAYAGEPLRNVTVISCVDQMSVRKTIWKEVKNKSAIDLFCDSRVAKTYIEVLSMQPFARKDIERYETLLFSDKEAARQMCGEHGIVYGSVNAARVIATNVASLWTGGKVAWRFAERCDTLTRAY